MPLSHDEILEILPQGVIEGATPEAVNSASLDIHLGRYILEEVPCQMMTSGCRPFRVVHLSKRDALTMRQVDLDKNGPYLLRPGHFILAQSQEIFNLPNVLSAEYKLKSSMARIALDHANAGWCDAGWTGSVLTLEIVNHAQHHAIVLAQGDPIGQMVFFKHAPVPADRSYAARGRYNGDKEVQGIKV